jgi:hypothetical protein
VLCEWPGEQEVEVKGRRTGMMLDGREVKGGEKGVGVEVVMVS